MRQGDSWQGKSAHLTSIRSKRRIHLEPRWDNQGTFTFTEECCVGASAQLATITQSTRREDGNEKLRTVDITSDCAIEVDRHLVRGVSSLPGAHLVDLYLGLHEYQSHCCVSHEAREAGNTPEHLRGT